MTDDPVARRYLTNEYADQNPDWDSGDSPWKGAQVLPIAARGAT